MAVEIICNAPLSEIISAALRLHGPMVVAKIAAVTGLREASVQRTVERMERAGKVCSESIWSVK